MQLVAVSEQVQLWSWMYLQDDWRQHRSSASIVDRCPLMSSMIAIGTFAF